MPLVTVNAEEHAVLVPRLTTLDTTALGDAVATLAPHRDPILSAGDLLIFGV